MLEGRAPLAGFLSVDVIMQTSRFPLVGLRVAATALLTLACAQADRADSRAEPAATAAATLERHLDRTWELAALDTQPLPPSPPSPPSSGTREPGRHPGPGHRPTIQFSRDTAVGALDAPPGARRVGGWSFCNGYGSAYTLGPGDALRFHGFQSTLVGCDGPDSLETRFFRGLGRAERIAFDGDTLSLVAGDGSRVRFVPAPGR